jgi:hypothetical protein
MATIFGWTAGVLMFGAALTTQGGLIAAWTFDTQIDPPTGLAPNSDVTYNPSGVSASLTGVGGAVAGISTVNKGSTDLNDPRGTPANPNYCLAVGVLSGFVTIQVNAAGLSAFSLSYAAVDLNPGGGSLQDWKWSTDGVTYTGLPDSSSTGINTLTWSLNSVNFNSASGSTLYFQDTLSGFVAFDNFQLTAVPEPINYALAVFGLCVGGICFGRRFVRKLSRT